MIKFLLLLNIFYLINADVYMHNPRGSNNRCDRRTNDRANANRLFDSQNNAAGGYAVPCDRLNDKGVECYKMNYFEGSELDIRWTLQHNCGSLNHCEVNLQYSCEDPDLLGLDVRDGKPQNINGNTCEDTIPVLSDDEIDNKEKYGRHEDFGYYQRCMNSFRNPGLPVFDQKLRGNRAIYTRQNPNGNRYGFECAEERDYYPYWRDSPWIDIAVITSRPQLCDLYKNSSQNTNSKMYCVGASKYIFNLTECDEYGGHLIRIQSYKELNFPVKEPECIPFKSTPPSNRLHESSEHNTQSYKWTLPYIEKNMKNCILRVRYNISTNEVPFYNNILPLNSYFRTNPQINTTIGVPVRLAIDTSQYGRTFEDRSFTFDIIKRTSDLNKEKIINVNVQGKRGNIAQIRNCVEYDFVPNNITITDDEYLHFQWVGSDYNPPENDGEGRAGTDRSNLVFIDDLKDNFPSLEMNIFDKEILIKLASIDQPYQNKSVCVFPNNDEQSINNCAILNNAPPYFNMGPITPIKLNKSKKVYAISTRNNNFSNRDQKLILNIIANNQNPNKDSISDSILNSDSDSEKNKYVVGFTFFGIIIIVIIVGSVIYVRKNDITCLKIKKTIERNLSSTI